MAIVRGKVEWHKTIRAWERHTGLLVDLGNLIENAFDLEELAALAFDLGVDLENITGDKKEAKARNLVLYFQRRGNEDLQKLIVASRKARPNLPWPNS